MSEKGLTNISLKKINKSKVYQYIYRKKTTSKLQIVQELQMGLSTVSQNLNLLEQEGLIEKNGFFESTGGRKANALQIVSDFKISIGIGILKGMFHITAVDLYGNAFYTDTIPLPYSNTPDYYKQVTDAVKEFISSRQYDNDKVLGISIATQGITSPDHTTVLYGDIMNNAGMKLDDFSRYLPYPCYLEHDSKSAAFLELWNHPELDSAVIILLNRNLGGGIITNHQIHQGISMHSGTLEHMCINPDGPLCYCGSGMFNPRRPPWLRRQPWLPGNLLLCQCTGTGCRYSCQRIFPSSARKKISPNHTDLERLFKPSGICHEKS